MLFAKVDDKMLQYEVNFSSDESRDDRQAGDLHVEGVVIQQDATNISHRFGHAATGHGNEEGP